MPHSRPNHFILGCVLSWLALTGRLAAADADAALTSAGIEFFERKIRPVLVEHCYKCHSAQSEKLKGGLLLDTREGLLKGGESGQPVLVPGDSEKSRLIEAIRYRNSDLQMPPKEKLRDDQIADFVAWVNLGAPDPRTKVVASISDHASRIAHHATNHWAFQSPRAALLPIVKNIAWPQSPIDFFMLAKLEEKDLSPAPQADKRTLLRRATYDLIGLPPTPAEMEAFLADHSPNAFAKVVDRLLASEHYGERWGRYWLDLSRYSDTKGYVYYYEESRFVHPHTYRDWVVRSFNEDLPYDRFLFLQLAADQLSSTLYPQPSTLLASLPALGFLTLGRRFLSVESDIIDDQIDVVMRGTQGLTVGCARCHDHKFDPIPTRDYYSLYGVFKGSVEKIAPLVSHPEPTKEYLAFEQELKQRQEKLATTFQARVKEMQARYRSNVLEYLVAVLEMDKLPGEDVNLRLEPNDLNPSVVRQWHGYLTRKAKEFDPVFAPWHALDALPAKDFASQPPAVWRQLTNNASRALNPLVVEAFAQAPPTSMRDVAQRYATLLTSIDRQWRDAAAQSQIANQKSQMELRQIFYGPDSPLNPPPGSIIELRVQEYFHDPARVELSKLQAEIERWIITAPGAPLHAVVLEDNPIQQDPRVFIRGNPSKKGEAVPRQFLKVLAKEKQRPFTKGSGRLELAQAIASRDNPLTARVMVNRIWLHHFGAGLVRTPSDFGTRCEPPSHLELLDWLACRFMDDGWSIKKMHRIILNSATWQQRSAGLVTSESVTSKSVIGNQYSVRQYLRTAPQSRGNATLKTDSLITDSSTGAATIDPENRLLSYFSRQRLDFESLRDSLLTVTGELDPRLGGPATDLTFQRSNSLNEFHRRRTLYGHIDRKFIAAVMRQFDFANPDTHTPQRYTTTVPQQALFFLNSPFVVERARALIRRSEVNAFSKPAQRIHRLYKLLYQSEPTATELEAGLQFIKAALAEPPLEPPKPIVSPWQYGFGEFDESQQRVKSFQPLTRFSAEAWQAATNLADKKLGGIQLTADGGRAGNDLQHAAIRRWVAPQDGFVAISGSLAHDSKGNGETRALIVSSRSGLVANWKAAKETIEARVSSVAIKRGDTLDFVLDFRVAQNPDRGFTQDSVKGVMRVSVDDSAADPNHLLYIAPGYSDSVQEILTRIRVLKFGKGAAARGGVGVVVSTNTSRGINFQFRDEEIPGRHARLHDDYVAWGPEVKFAWATNQWVWMRLRHEPEKVQAKIWPADGASPEPSEWQSWAHASGRTGFAGITSAANALSVFEVDYILIKADGLPAIGANAKDFQQSDARLTLPFEFGKTVNGFQDDFDSATLNPNWIPVSQYLPSMKTAEFKWAPVIKLIATTPNEVTTAAAIEWNAKNDFTGPPAQLPEPLTAWEEYAQVLLLANEFHFID